MNYIKQLVCFLYAMLLVLPAYSDRADRPFTFQTFKDVGVEIFIPLKPEWEYSTEKTDSKSILLLNSPALFYPQAALEISVDRSVVLDTDDFQEVSLGFINHLRTDLGFAKPLTKGELKAEVYGKYSGYSNILNIRSSGELYDLKLLLLKMNSKHPVVVMLTTRRGQLEHVEHIMYKMFSNLKVVELSR